MRTIRSKANYTSDPDPFDGFEDYATQGWDGDGAEPITSEILAGARRFHSSMKTLEPQMPEANISPGPDGTVGFEWRSSTGDFKKLFAEIRPDGTLRAYAVRHSGEFEWQQPLLINVGIAAFRSLLRVVVSPFPLLPTGEAHQ